MALPHAYGRLQFEDLAVILTMIDGSNPNGGMCCIGIEPGWTSWIVEYTKTGKPVVGRLNRMVISTR